MTLPRRAPAEAIRCSRCGRLAEEPRLVRLPVRCEGRPQGSVIGFLCLRCRPRRWPRVLYGWFLPSA